MKERINSRVALLRSSMFGVQRQQPAVQLLWLEKQQLVSERLLLQIPGFAVETMRQRPQQPRLRGMDWIKDWTIYLEDDVAASINSELRWAENTRNGDISINWDDKNSSANNKLMIRFNCSNLH